MDQVRIGIVGAGIGRIVSQTFSRDPRARVVTLCDLQEDRMQALAAELPAPVLLCTDYRELCADPHIDAIFVGTPNQWHVPVALEAVRNGKHVLVTKPLSDSVEAARQLVEEAEAAGVVNMMSLTLRYSPETQYLGRLALEGAFGEIYYARARSVRRSGIPGRPGFVMQGGGAFRDMGVHFLDSAWWMLGMPRPVTASAVAGAKFGPHGRGYMNFATPTLELSRQFAADDFAGGFIRFENGAGMQVESFWASHQPEDRQIELFGTEGGARLYPLTLYSTRNDAPVDSTIELPKAPNGWEGMAAHFVACILDGIACQSPLRHGLLVQEMLEAILVSAETGREVIFGGSGV
jgi:predicted dehydrogenase